MHCLHRVFYPKTASHFSENALKHILNESWQLTLAAWAIPVLLVIVLWLPQLKSHSGEGAAARYQVKDLLKQPIAWQVTIFMGL